MNQYINRGYKEQEQIKNCMPPKGAMKNIAEFYSIFSDGTRLRILSALSLSELCVGDLCEVLDVNQTTLSHQLKIMRDAKIVDTRRNGKTIYYRIINPLVNEVMLTGVNHLSVI